MMATEGTLRSVNLGRIAPSPHAERGTSGIDKRPAAGAVEIRDPGSKGIGGSGLVGDAIANLRHHGGSEQAVYAYAREDLDAWEVALGRELACGAFGENLTTVGIDVTAARIGERWRVGERCTLQVTSPRIPCRTFAGWLAEAGWIRRFTERGAPGAYFRVLVPGPVHAGDPIAVVRRPDHDVTIGLTFRALTTQKALLPRLLAAGDDLPEETRDLVHRWQRRQLAGRGTG